MTVVSNTPAARRLGDWIHFEAPWFRAVLLIATMVLAVMVHWQSAIAWALVSFGCVCSCCVVIGMPIQRKSLARFVAAAGVGVLAGLLLPASAVQAIWLFVAMLLGLLVVGLRYYCPYRAQRVRAGDSYAIGNDRYESQDITFTTARIFYVRQEFLEQVVALAAYADEFLGRHGISYVICYGTLLGMIRHRGPIPWDDDVDFTIYRPGDIRKLEESFAELAAVADKDGYCLFAHNDYWKLCKKGFWRYPVVDLYRAAIHHPIDKVPQRAAWGPLKLSAPDNAKDHVIAYYGEESLKEVVFDIPYWDSGFATAAATRLLGIGFANLAGDLYQKVFSRS